MESDSRSPLCYRCEYRCDCPGSAHSECRHPSLDNDIASKCLAMLEPDVYLGVTGDPHGIRCGWFYWPFNFDPIWLKTCDGFKEKSNG